MAKHKKENLFEDNLDRVEAIIEKLNNDNLPLQEAIALHTEAMELIKTSQEFLQKATLQFETL